MEPQTNNNEPVQNTSEPTTLSAEVSKADNASTTEAPKGDMSEYRTFAIVGYVIPILFFLPLLDNKTKNVPYVRFHANQQLVLLVTAFAIHVMSAFLVGPLTLVGSYVMQAFYLAFFALVIAGVYTSYKGEMNELPFIGKFKILK